MSRPAGFWSSRAQVAGHTSELQSLRERLVAEGLHGNELAEVLEATRRVAAQPGQTQQLHAALENPAALIERVRAVQPRPNSSGAALAGLVLGVLAGPPLAYAAVGNPWQTYPATIPRWAAGAVGIALVLLLLAMSSRYQRPAALGALAGAGGGLAQVALASVPWLTVASSHPGCTSRGACTVAPSLALGYAVAAALAYAVPLVVALAGLSGVVGYWAQRGRFESAFRHLRAHASTIG
jgi:hypothetical protein